MTDRNTNHITQQCISRRAFLAGSIIVPAALRNATAHAATDTPLSFGIVTDVHYAQMYANSDRYYTGLYDKLKEAVDTFTLQDVDFLIELGDLIHAVGERKDEIEHLEEIESVYRTFPKDCYHTLGNHDLQCLTKKEFLKYTDQHDSQYSFDVKGYHFTVLDACFSPDGSEYRQGRFDWTKSFIPKSSLDWLAKDMREAAGKTVIAFIHQTLHNDGARHCVQNAPEVRAILESHGDVHAVFQGHMHFNQHVAINDIHYITLAAMVNGRTRESNPYGIVNFASDGTIAFDGYGQNDYAWDPSEPWVQPPTRFGRRG